MSKPYFTWYLVRQQINSHSDRYGVYFSSSAGKGVVDFIHLDETGKVLTRMISLEDFADGKPVQRILCEYTGSDVQIWERIESLMREAKDEKLLYSLDGSSGWNNEVAALFILTGKRTSIFQLKEEQKIHGILSLNTEGHSVGQYKFVHRNELYNFAWSQSVKEEGTIDFIGSDAQELSKAMYEAGKLGNNKNTTYVGGGLAFGVPGIAIALGSVAAAPIAIPGFLAAYMGAKYFNNKAQERIEDFKKGFPLGEIAWRLYENGWFVIDNSVVGLITLSKRKAPLQLEAIA